MASTLQKIMKYMNSCIPPANLLNGQEFMILCLIFWLSTQELRVNSHIFHLEQVVTPALISPGYVTAVQIVSECSKPRSFLVRIKNK